MPLASCPSSSDTMVCISTGHCHLCQSATNCLDVVCFYEIQMNAQDMWATGYQVLYIVHIATHINQMLFGI